MLLDTCALLWLVEGGGELSKETLRKINEAAVVYISSVTGFEITLKHRAGKLDLPAIPSDWFKTILSHHDIQVIPLDLDLCIKACELPLIHRDPCDRFIIATSHLYNLSVVTKDRRFAEYGVDILF